MVEWFREPDHRSNGLRRDGSNPQCRLVTLGRASGPCKPRDEVEKSDEKQRKENGDV